MNRYVFRRLTLIPRVLVAVNFFGFAYIGNVTFQGRPKSDIVAVV